MVRVVADVASITKEFDYLVADRWADLVQVGSMVRVPLHGRQIAAWVVAVDVVAPGGVELLEVSKVSSIGPPAEIIDLCRWAAGRWCGRLPAFLGTASPPTMVKDWPAPRAHRAPAVGAGGRSAAVFDALFEPAPDPVGAPVRVVELPPAESPMGVLLAAARRGPTLVVCPTFAQSRELAEQLRRAEVSTALHPDGWVLGASGVSVVGARSAVFAPVAGLSSIVVIDEHDEALQNEGSPTWHAREVAIERARRGGIPVVLVSPVPSLEARGAATDPVLVASRARQRRGWARVEVIDRRDEDVARSGLYSEALVRSLQSGRRVLCILNRTGRARMTACLGCGSLATCERCEAAVRQEREDTLDCPSCGMSRPVVCGNCGSTAMKGIRLGVTKAREQLETLLREPVGELAGAARRSGGASVVATRADHRVMVGTEAALHRAGPTDVVAFLEFDQELGAPRFRAADQAMALLARASRLVGGRERGDGSEGLVLVQTRLPDHEVLVAAQRAEPARLVAAELERRTSLVLPPVGCLAVIGGEAAASFMADFTVRLGGDPGAPAVQIDQSGDDQWIVRCGDRQFLLSALGSVPRPAGRLRLQVDPARPPG